MHQQEPALAPNVRTATLRKLRTSWAAIWKRFYTLCAFTGFQQARAADNNCQRVMDAQSTFQVLATETQDLAALVGLFATDSVERYAVDYSRGYLSVAVATCSLLGILGYVRALLKLALGSKLCTHSAFMTAPVRPILGVAEIDRLPKEELATVAYIRSSRSGDGPHEIVTFELVKKLNHTEESFPAARVLQRLPVSNLSPRKGQYDYFLRNPATDVRTHIWVLGMSWLSLVCSAAATSFAVLSIPSEWGWTRIVATFGLFVGLAASSVMWSYVYMKQQLPRRWRFTSLRGLKPFMFLMNPKFWLLVLPGKYFEGLRGSLNHMALMSTTKERYWEEFAIMRPAQAGSRKLVVCDLQAVTGVHDIVCRALSMGFGILICLGYVCQYVELRKANVAATGRWLGIQTGLALLRVFIWIWDPAFDNFDDFSVTVTHSAGEARIDEGELAVMLFSVSLPSYNPTRIDFPGDMLQRLEDEALMRSLLDQAHEIVCSGSMAWDIRMTLRDNKLKTWVFPPGLFAKWLGVRSRSVEAGREPSTKYTCVIVLAGARSWLLGRVILVPLISPDDTFPYFRIPLWQLPPGFDVAYVPESGSFRHEQGLRTDCCSSEDVVQELTSELQAAVTNLPRRNEDTAIPKEELSNLGPKSL
ncbi:hypothetical protein BDZ91DRAFT_413832 [Kalaharituber pfeilii]|nr:hypothetical protein BDZ91DRAFT_413832 [Kalaharituber pfeilii]